MKLSGWVMIWVGVVLVALNLAFLVVNINNDAWWWAISGGGAVASCTIIYNGRKMLRSAIRHDVEMARLDALIAWHKARLQQLLDDYNKPV